MRLAFSLIFILVIVALFVCAVIAARSQKEIGSSVALLLCALIPPVFGNMLIIYTRNLLVSDVGRYIYFLGMDFIMLALLRFTFAYCNMSARPGPLRYFVYALLTVDALQLLCNPFFGHAFSSEKVMVDGYAYYKLVPKAGQTFHRLVDYGIFLAVLIIFLIKTIRTTRIYSERYSVLLLCMIVAGLWQTLYIFSRSPIDRSMIGFAVFGFLVFYFSLYYRPMRLIDRMLANVASDTQDALFFFDPNGRCIWMNQHGLNLLGLSPDEFDPVGERLAGIFGAREEGYSLRCVIHSGRYYELKEHQMKDEKGLDAGYYLMVHDSTEERREMRRAMYNATHDRLTGLYARERLFEEIQEVLASGHYIISIDVDNFKLVNDVFGNAFGDHALRSVADWMREEFSENAIYGRISGDKFGVYIPIEEFGPDKIEESLTNFVVREGSTEYVMLIHLGVFEVRQSQMDVSVMFDWANMALFTIKGNGRTHIAYYDEKMREQAVWDQQISVQLEKAIMRKELRPYLQPLVDSTGKIIGAEVLARWIHPTYGFLSPNAFIPPLEESGLIAVADRYMWRSACEILSRWDNDLFLSVNISPKDFYYMDVTREIKSIVQEFKVDPTRLRLEITETVMMSDLGIQSVYDLRNAGFIIEMDDFGSGYSSLNLLKEMPLDVLKIDRVFLNESDENTRTKTILHSIIRLSDDMGIISLMEGVETESQYHMLLDMGCKIFQGYYFAKPMPVADFESSVLKAGHA